MTVGAARTRQKNFGIERARLHAPLPGAYLVHPKTPKVIPQRAYCRLQRVTADSMSFVGLGGGSKGDMASVHIKELGILTGRITRTIGALMMMDIHIDEEPRRRKLEGLIGWLDRRHRLRLPENRRSNRFEPKCPETRVLLPDGFSVECYMLDLSGGGAHLACSIIPRLGDTVMLGRLAGRVVRHTQEGFAMQFYEPQAYDQVEELVASEAVELL